MQRGVFHKFCCIDLAKDKKGKSYECYDFERK